MMDSMGVILFVNSKFRMFQVLSIKTKCPSFYRCWVHKKCSGIKGPLGIDLEFRLRLDFEAVIELCYLGDMLSARDGFELAAVKRCKCAWGKFS